MNNHSDRQATLTMLKRIGYDFTESDDRITSVEYDDGHRIVTTWTFDAAGMLVSFNIAVKESH